MDLMDITVNNIAVEMNMSIKKIIKYFLDIGISKNINDHITIQEKKKLIHYLVKHKLFINTKYSHIKTNMKSKKDTSNIHQKNILLHDKLYDNEKKIVNNIKFKKITNKPFKKVFSVINEKKKNIIIYNKNGRKKTHIRNKFSIKQNYKINNLHKKISDIHVKNSIIPFIKKKKYPQHHVNKLQQAFTKPSKNIIRNIILYTNKHISLQELADKMAIKSAVVTKNMMNIGILNPNNKLLDQKTAQLIVQNMGHRVILRHKNELERSLLNTQNINIKLQERDPIVTLMGHVDHGKTSILDYILSTKIQSKESGGITQNINAYQVTHKNQNITFIDTPGHELFSLMRSRGISITDIIILVIAIDDGIMPQTIEIIKYAQEYNVPIIVGINKIDKNIFNIEKIKNDLSKYNIISDQWGGNNIFVSLSAKTGIGINKLLDAILLQAEMLELKARFQGIAQGVVIESYLDKNRGPVANIIVQEGTLKKGDMILCGTTYGKIKTLKNCQGKLLLTAEPSSAVEIVGLSHIPYAGDTFIVVTNEKKIRSIVSYRKDQLRNKKITIQQKNFKNKFIDLNQKHIQKIHVLLKCYTQGSIEIIKNALMQIIQKNCSIEIINTGVGNITETDVILASTTNNMIVIGFNVTINSAAKRIMISENINVRIFTVIYNLIDNFKNFVNSFIAPIYTYQTLGTAEVKNIFTIQHIGVIAGCTVKSGFLQQHHTIRVIRNDKIICETTIESLRRFKDSVTEVSINMECGIIIKNFNNIKIHDKIESFIKIENRK
ncbi:translation initiation factor IF-2 [Enterobacteriaceae endosymbiont of Macroplea appendiculata]|uniref:translation initiation factor IF-2 n=1 Tax=Enterobacteriaceae endosymbiont of Macroplea appendiculata TaxID=2675790 RepID=UPI0014491E2F|nr:translation initiation factor IF-2 [Enterobacteriaceae endosymbiont of Macroplea appendiculata]QJC30915.1 translation initiation factor IF-2 [Enterobacteriaceae endosymbiont of Macroplea appendiculata]